MLICICERFDFTLINIRLAHNGAHTSDLTGRSDLILVKRDKFAALVDVFKLAWRISMVKPLLLAHLGNMRVGIDGASASQHISQLLVVQLAIFVDIDEVVDVEKLLRLDTDIAP